MKKIKLSHRFIGLALLCAILFAAFLSSGLLLRAHAAEDVVVYFYNSHEWESVYAHCYVQGGTEYTNWPGDALEATPDKGEGWYGYKLPVSIIPNLRVQFNDGTDANKNDVKIADGEHIYFNAYRREGFTTVAEALANNSEQVIEETGTTRVYFYNSRRWKNVYAYVYGTDASETEYTRSWPGNITSRDEERENWYYIDIKQDCEKVAFNIIFNNQSSGGNNQSKDTLIDDHENVYLNFSGVTFTNYEDCEAVTPLEEIVEEEVLDPEDFYLDLDNMDTTPKTDRVIRKPSLTVPIAAAAVAFAGCVALGTAILIRRKKDVHGKTRLK